MKERPILFSGPMVRALLDGSKTQTRRILKRQPYLSRTNPPHFSDVEVGDLFVCPDYFPTDNTRRSVIAECTQRGTYHCMGVTAFAEKHSPYGVVGDRLWVRETWSQPTTLDPGPAFFRADYPACVPHNFENVPSADAIRWKPSIHMPRAISRITLEITGIRVERLNSISEDDAKAEGCAPAWLDVDGDLVNAMTPPTYKQGFARLWRDINGADSWETNPWVWVVEFRRLSA
jgi:hypothetical protein